MHEFSLAQNVIETAIDVAKKHHAKQIKQIALKFGQFALVVEDQFRFCFDVLKKDNILTKDTNLSIEWIDGELECKKCDFCGSSKPDPNDVNALMPLFRCPKCGSFDTNIISGTETFIENISIQ